MKASKQHSTAILIFANSSYEEIRHKKISCGEPLFDALTQQILKTVEKTKIPFFHLTEVEQKGTYFGERFANAIQSVFEKGFEKIITVGNDSPHLTKAHLLSALSQLESGKSVIGPSADGGFYLMGMHRSDFKKYDFEKLSWQTSKIRKEVIDLLSSRSTEINLLPKLFDIDSLWDVKILAKNASRLAKTIAEAILSILPCKTKIEIPSFFLYDGFHSQTLFNKGSPIPVLS